METCYVSHLVVHLGTTLVRPDEVFTYKMEYTPNWILESAGLERCSSKQVDLARRRGPMAQLPFLMNVGSNLNSECKAFIVAVIDLDRTILMHRVRSFRPQTTSSLLPPLPSMSPGPRSALDDDSAVFADDDEDAMWCDEAPPTPPCTQPETPSPVPACTGEESFDVRTLPLLSPQCSWVSNLRVKPRRIPVQRVETRPTLNGKPRRVVRWESKHKEPFKAEIVALQALSFEDSLRLAAEMRGVPPALMQSWMTAASPAEAPCEASEWWVREALGLVDVEGKAFLSLIRRGLKGWRHTVVTGKLEKLRRRYKLGEFAEKPQQQEEGRENEEVSNLEQDATLSVPG